MYDPFREFKCTICGKNVLPTPQWVYKIFDGKKTNYYCSWSCYKKGKYENKRMSKRCSNCKRYPFCYKTENASGICDDWEQMKER